MLTGFVDESENKLLFYSDADQYKFTLLSAIPKPGRNQMVYPKDGFIYGTTHDGGKIAIAAPYRELEIGTTLTLFPDLYIQEETAVHNSDFYYFSSICFYGGVLNSLMASLSIATHFTGIGEEQVQRNLEKKIYSFPSPYGNCTLAIGKVDSSKTYTHKVELENTIFLKVSFDKPQPLSSIRRHYSVINTLISFMTHRQKNHFEKIVIAPSTDDPNWFLKQSTVHFRIVDEAKSNSLHHICFEDMGDGVATLLEIIYNSKEKKPSYSLGFIPQSDDEAQHFSDDLVRSVCAGLECEIAQDKSIHSDQEEALRGLCKSVKELIKTHESEHKDNPVLTEGTYALIEGSVDHWSKSASETYCILYHKYETAMLAYQKFKHPPISDEDIRAFVKYRNGITHGTYQEATQEIIRTTMVMKALVYCSILARIGVQKQTIEKLCLNAICK